MYHVRNVFFIAVVHPITVAEAVARESKLDEILADNTLLSMLNDCLDTSNNEFQCLCLL